MRIDTEHRKTIATSIIQTANGPKLRMDLEALDQAKERLSLWEVGLMMACLVKASIAKRKSREQRVLLALFGARDGKAARHDRT